MQDFTLVAIDGTYASSLATAVDMLVAARNLTRVSQAPVPSWRICSPAGGLVRLDSGFMVDTLPLVTDQHDRSTWIVPAVAVNSELELLARLDQPHWIELSRLLRIHLSEGGRVAASASAVFLLDDTGILAGRRVTTAWWLAGALRRTHAGLNVDCDKALCIDGPVTTCGLVFAQSGLLLHLIGQLCGPQVAEKLSLLWLRSGSDPDSAGDLLRSFEARHAIVARIVEAVERSLPDSPSVADLADALAVSERTLSRYVRRVTGKTTIALVQDVKLRRARALLERSRMSIDQIAAAVGYSDSTALRRLMKKVTGSQPSRYRAACLPA